MSQQIFFAHANGFPSGTYGKLFAALAPEYQVTHLEQHAHDPRFPADDNWYNLVDELIHHLKQQPEPVWGVGHSFGGVLHLHAALRCPELYRGVVMLDSPVLTRADQWVIRAAKRFGFIDRLTPAGRTLGRREEFADLEAARLYFAGKTLFRSFDPECFDAYLQHGLHKVGDKLRLRFDPATEISIYRGVPHTSPGRTRQLKVPLAVVRGHKSRVVMRHHASLVGRMPLGESLTMPGGHMFPLERPQDTATLLKESVQPLGRSPPTGLRMSNVVEEVRLSLPHIELAAHLFGPEDGMPVIALHGWLDNANSFARLAPKLKGLRIIALDMAGHGHSGHRPTGAGYALWDYAHDVLQVAEQLGWKRFAPAGAFHGRDRFAGAGRFVAGAGDPSGVDRRHHSSYRQRRKRCRTHGHGPASAAGFAGEAQTGLQHPRPGHRSAHERLGRCQSRSRRTAGPTWIDAGAGRLYLAHR